MNFHPLSIKLLKQGEQKPVYLETRSDMNLYSFNALVSLKLENVTFHVGDIVYFEDTFYIFSMIPSIRLNQYGLESFGFVPLRENTEMFFNLTSDSYYDKDEDEDYYLSSKKQVKLLSHSDDFYNFMNQGVEKAVTMSKKDYQFIGNPLYMDMYYVEFQISDILTKKYPNKEINILIEELFKTSSTFYTVNFRFPLLSKAFEDTIDSLIKDSSLKKTNYDTLFYIAATNDWSFRLVVTNYKTIIKELESINTNAYLAGSIFELRLDETTKDLINQLSNSNDFYREEVKNKLNNQKQILIYLTKEGTIQYADKSTIFVEHYQSLIPLREKFFNICYKYIDNRYKEKVLNIIG